MNKYYSMIHILFITETKTNANNVSIMCDCYNVYNVRMPEMSRLRASCCNTQLLNMLVLGNQNEYCVH